MKCLVSAASILLSFGVVDAHAQISQVLNFADRPGPVTVASEGVEVTLQPTKEDDDFIDLTVAIRAPGFQSVIVKQGVAARDGYDRWVGLARLSKTDQVPSVLLTGFTGGAHCCSTLSIVTPVAGKLKTIEFASIDGDTIKSLPTDIDGDGTLDIVRQDDSFRYQFSSGAGSFSPPVILNVYKGQIVDVSAEPSFSAVWRDFAAQTRRYCADRSNGDRNGACAAYVAASARLGRFEQAMGEVEKLANRGEGIVLPEPCKTTLVNYACPKGQEIKFYTFSSALRWHLREQGYIE